MDTQQLLIASKIDRCLEIEKEYDSLEAPQLDPHSIENVDDLYQAKLEYNYYVQDLKDEYETLNKELGYTLRKLYPVESRRLPMSK
jgi:hypothetical protein